MCSVYVCVCVCVCARVRIGDGKDLDTVVAEVKPLQRRQVSKRVDDNSLNGAITQVQMLEFRQRGEILTLNDGAVKCVAVEVQLNGACCNVGRNGRQTASRAVDDVTECVTETSQWARMTGRYKPSRRRRRRH